MANIQININKKVAGTNFREVVSFNNSDRLQFTFDEEWDEFPVRVAVALWANGSSEQSFTGTECAFPMIGENSSDFVLLGVYSANKDKRIASTFVRLKCREGAHSTPSEECLPTVQEQLLAIVNGHDWSLSGETVEAGTYSSVQVNKHGQVMGGGKIIEFGEEGQNIPSDSLSIGGLFFKNENGSYAPYTKTSAGLLPVNLGVTLSNALKIGSKQFNGSTPVNVTARDLGLVKLATTGSYNDLTDKPTLSQVMSVNGKTGKVTITKEDVGLGYVLNLNTLPLGLNIAYGMNFNNQLEAGIADYMGTPSAPSQNAPISASNPSQEDGYWALLTLGRVPYGVTQVAFSLRADRAIRIRSYLHSEKFWMPWAEVFN